MSSLDPLLQLPRELAVLVLVEAFCAGGDTANGAVDGPLAGVPAHLALALVSRRWRAVLADEDLCTRLSRASHPPTQPATQLATQPPSRLAWSVRACGMEWNVSACPPSCVMLRHH